MITITADGYWALEIAWTMGWWWRQLTVTEPWDAQWLCEGDDDNDGGLLLSTWLHSDCMIDDDRWWSVSICWASSSLCTKCFLHIIIILWAGYQLESSFPSNKWRQGSESPSESTHGTSYSQAQNQAGRAAALSPDLCAAECQSVFGKRLTPVLPFDLAYGPVRPRTFRVFFS